MYSVHCSYITGEDENDYDDDDRKFKFRSLHGSGREWEITIGGGYPRGGTHRQDYPPMGVQL